MIQTIGPGTELGRENVRRSYVRLCRRLAGPVLGSSSRGYPRCRSAAAPMPLPGAGEGLRLYAAPRPSSGVGWAAGLLGRIGWKVESVELLIARNPDPDSRLPYLLWLPLAGGMVFRTSGTWPRTNALYCYPVSADEWPETPDIVERAGVRSCVRRGAAIDLILDRGRENRSQIVFTRARGRDAVFWQSPRTRKQARPNVTTPTARAAGIAELEIVVDSHEQYAYRFGGQRVSTVKRPLPCGDYGLVARRSARRLCRAQVPYRPGGQPDRREAPLRARRTCCAAPRRDRGRGPLLPGVQAGAGPARAGRRRSRRTPDPLAQRSGHLLRDPPARRGMDLPVPGRRPRMGRYRDRRDRAARTNGRSSPARPSSPRRRMPPSPPRRKSGHGRAAPVLSSLAAAGSRRRSGPPGAQRTPAEDARHNGCLCRPSAGPCPVPTNPLCATVANRCPLTQTYRRAATCAHYRGNVTLRDQYQSECTGSRPRVLRNRACPELSRWDAQECSGRGLEDFDEAAGPGGPCEFLVAGEQRGAHGFGECYIGRVVDGEVVP